MRGKEHGDSIRAPLTAGMPMSIADRRAAFNALVACYHNSFENVKEGATKHSPQFIRKALLSEAGRAALQLDPRLTSTNAGAVAVGIARNVLTSEKAARAFIDVEISEGAFIVSFDNTVNADAAYGICQLSGTAAVLCKSGDKIGEGLTSDLLILAVEPTQAVSEAYVAAEKGQLDESASSGRIFAHADSSTLPKDARMINAGTSHESAIHAAKQHLQRTRHLLHPEEDLHGMSDGNKGHYVHVVAPTPLNAPKGEKDEHYHRVYISREKAGKPLSERTLKEAEVGPIDKETFHKAEKAAIDQYGAKTRDSNPDKFYAITMSIYKKMKGVKEDGVSKPDEQGQQDYPIVPRSAMAESLHNDVTKSLSHAGMDGSKLFHAPGEGWSALHGALAKHGLVIHPDSMVGDHSTHHRGVYQLARPSAKPGHDPEPIEGAYLAVQRTAGVGDGEGVDGSDHPIKGKHEFNTYLTGKKLKESTVSDIKTTEYHQSRIEHIKGLMKGAPDEDKARLKDHLGLEQDRLKKAKAKTNEAVEVTESALQGALTKADISTLHAFVHEGKVTEFAEKGNRTTVSFTHKVPGADVAHLHKALGGHEAFGHLIDGSSHNHTTGQHRFTAYGKDHAERANKFAAHVKEKLGVEPKVDDRSVHMSESTAKQKLQSLLRVFAMPGSRTVKEADGFDAVLAKVLARTTKGWKRTAYGMLSESDEQFAQVVDEVCEALATEVPKAEMERRFISESAAITGDTLNESVMQKSDVYATHLQAVTRAVLLGNGFAAPSVDAALNKWASANA